MFMQTFSALAANDAFQIAASAADKTGGSVQAWAFPAGVIAAAATLLSGKFGILRAILSVAVGGLAYFAIHDYDAFVPVIQNTWANLTSG
jgi:hypothetical protein